VHLLAPERYLDEQKTSEAQATVRFPWPIRDVVQEVEEARAGKTGRSVALRDGLEFSIEASPEALPRDVVAAVYVGIFSYSLTGSEASVEQWMRDGNLPPPHNPLRLWTLFTHQYQGGKAEADELGDACVGEAFRAEFCARVMTCFNVAGTSAAGGGSWQVAVPIRFASNYRVEAYLGEPMPHCREYLPREAAALGPSMLPWWAPPVAEHAVPSRSFVATHAAYSRVRVLFVNQMSYWWGQNAQVEATTSWTEMMAAAVQAASESPAALPTRFGRIAPPACPHGLWLEFGVGSGKTGAFIASQMKSYFGE
ncbi:unnamed protein product, partial [Polarella glacialis]